MGTIKEKSDKILNQKTLYVKPEYIKEGITLYGVTGTLVEGTPTADATATSSDILQGKTAYVKGDKLTGTMRNRGEYTIIPQTHTQEIDDGGYYSKITVPAVTAVIDPNIVPENIIKGVKILGVQGGAEVQATDATATAANILSGKTAYIRDGITTGTMQNNGTMYFSPKTTVQYIPQGYHTGQGFVRAIDSSVDSNIQAHNIKAGVTILGVTGVLDILDTYDATATSSSILIGQTAYIKGAKVTGTMPNRGSLYYSPSVSSDQTIPSGYTSGGRVYRVTSSIDSNIQPANIKEGVTILGVEGILTNTGIDTSDSTMLSSDLLSGKIGYNASGKVTGSMTNRGSKTFTPSTSSQSSGSGYYSGVSVGAVTSSIDSNIRPANIKAGVTILGVTGTVVPSDVTQISETINPSYNNAITRQNVYYSNLTVAKIPAVTSSVDGNIQPQNIKKNVTILGVTGTLEAGQISYEAGTLTILAGEYLNYNPKKQEGSMNVQEFDSNYACVCSGGTYVYLRLYFAIMQQQDLQITFTKGGYSRVLFGVLDSHLMAGTSDVSTNVYYDTSVSGGDSVLYNIPDAGKHYIDVKIISSSGTDTTTIKPTGINIRQKLISQVYSSIDQMNNDLSQAVGTYAFIYSISARNMIAVYRFDGEEWIEKSLADYSGTVTPVEYNELLGKADELNGEVIE